MKRPGQFSLLFVMPEISRSFFLTLDHNEQKRVFAEVSRKIRDTVVIDRLAAWMWANDRIETDDDGSKLDEDVREEIVGLLEDLGRGGNVITLGEPGVPVLLGGDKRPDCGVSFHAAYTLHIARRGGPSVPWVIASRLHPELLFEMRVAVEWIGLPLSVYELTPFGRKQPAKRRKARRKAGSQATGRRGRRKPAERSGAGK